MSEDKVAWVAKVSTWRGYPHIMIPADFVKHLKLKRHDLVLVAMQKLVREEKIPRRTD